ncbi:MAG: hypothetical protein HUU34_13695 [Saprospiraceae bacterium]|nr:hypothetical protein [Saprospiraceae bacterium]
MNKLIWIASLLLALPCGLIAQFSGSDPNAIFSRYNSGPSPISSGDTIGKLTFRGLTPSNQFQIGASILAYASGNVTSNSLPSSLIFRTGLTAAKNQMIITDSGRIGLGIMTPATSLHIPSEGYQIGFNAAISDNFYNTSDVAAGVRALRWYNGNYGSGNLYMSLTQTGNLGIGEEKPQERLVVKGNALIKGKETIQDRLFVGTDYTPHSSLSNYRIFTDGGILCTEVKILFTQNWPDYVFDNNYRLMELKEVEEFIKNNRHLPDVPNVHDIQDNGIDVGEMNAILLRKIEEITLYIIYQNNEIEQLKARLHGKAE